MPENKSKKAEVKIEDVKAEKGEKLYQVGVNFFKDKGYAQKFASKWKLEIKEVTKG